MNRHGHDIAPAIDIMKRYADVLSRQQLPSGSRVAIRRKALAMRAAMNEVYYDVNPGAGEWKLLETLVDAILADTKAPEPVRISRPYGDADASAILRP